MNKRPNPEGRKIKFVRADGTALFKYKQHKHSPNTVSQRRCRERMKRLIDCRVCCGCKYAFISTNGHNYCSPCWAATRALYVQHHLCNFVPSPAIVRGWAHHNLNQKMFQSIKPKIPCPNIPAIGPEIAATMDLMRLNIGTKGWRYDVMPRVVNLRPYSHLSPIADLRHFNGKKAA
jgi:hypothetical protein